MSHFAAIGLAGDRDAFGQLLDEAARLAREDAPPSPGKHLLWRDPSGAALALHVVEDDLLDCLTPWYAAAEPTRWRARTGAPLDDAECAHCGGADCDLLGDDGELITRATVQWLHYQPYRRWLGAPREFALHVVAFAHRLGCFADEAEFAAGQGEWFPEADPGEKPFRLATESFLPLGMFGAVGPAAGAVDMGERATALFSGRIETAATRENALSGHSFLHLKVRTLPGLVDVVVDAAGLDGVPAVGALALVQGWLVGRPEVAAP